VQPYACFGQADGNWDEATEATAPFGAFAPPRANHSAASAACGAQCRLLNGSSSYSSSNRGASLFAALALDSSNTTYSTPFLRGGIHGLTGRAVGPAGDSDSDSVQAERALFFSGTYSAFLHNRYLAPTHAVLLDTRDGLDANRAAVESLVGAGYVDLHTVAVLVDVALFNPMKSLTCQLRLVVEMPAGGGVVPSYEVGARGNIPPCAGEHPTLRGGTSHHESSAPHRTISPAGPWPARPRPLTSLTRGALTRPPP
jgi:hypothetical protein